MDDRHRLQSLERDLQQTKDRIAKSERDCSPHVWGPVTPDYIHHEAYTIPGDPPGTMGVDWRGPVNVPARTEHRWRRECKECGKVEYTTRTQDHVEKSPVF